MPNPIKWDDAWIHFQHPAPELGPGELRLRLLDLWLLGLTPEEASEFCRRVKAISTWRLPNPDRVDKSGDPYLPRYFSESPVGEQDGVVIIPISSCESPFPGEAA